MVLLSHHIWTVRMPPKNLSKRPRGTRCFPTIWGGGVRGFPGVRDRFPFTLQEKGSRSRDGGEPQGGATGLRGFAGGPATPLFRFRGGVGHGTVGRVRGQQFFIEKLFNSRFSCFGQDSPWFVSKLAFWIIFLVVLGLLNGCNAEVIG